MAAAMVVSEKMSPLRLTRFCGQVIPQFSGVGIFELVAC